ncbi:hypothetical protein I203_107303 [Kwoniella mangroviensis CBS 8507]|uniref:hypothetical protein n=1 Tax=Kwoniella mangroviensis CBS 8507 TaxID=1296122 RepID=UPI00080D6600|nr:uncharacterized protein I203_02048 [Kwoniella mangroviensis CBS 8507]OCF68664.1 hypothetical protein I203_02048 [Kwoniella mangroviensis CBS 8507]
MSLVDQLVGTISTLAPITLSVPTTPIFQVSRFIHHVTTTPIHPVYFPYLRFGVIHAVRVTTVWAGLKKGKKRGGRLQDLFGYLALAWGGSTVTSLLLNQPPSWLISPTPWIIYPLIYTLLVPTGLSAYIVDTCPTLLFGIIGGFVDGMTRGTTITSLATLLSSSSIGSSAISLDGSINLWTYALLSLLAISSGGLIVGALSLNEDEWKLGTPGLLKGGLINTLDAWSASLVGLLWLTLTSQNSSLKPISELIQSSLPHELKSSTSSSSSDEKVAVDILDVPHARAICVMVLGGLLATKAIILYVRGSKTKKVNKVDKTTELFILDEKDNEKTKVVKTPVKVGSSKPTPRKSPRAKSK